MLGVLRLLEAREELPYFSKIKISPFSFLITTWIQKKTTARISLGKCAKQECSRFPCETGF